MKEYWVNAYFHPFTGSQRAYVNIGLDRNKYKMSKPLYRIHVKMDGGYNKHKGPRNILKYGYPFDVNGNKLNWMGQ